MGKVIYNTISKILLYHCRDSEKPRVFLLGPTGISATINSGLRIISGPGTKLLGLNDKTKAPLRNSLLELKLLIIDELGIKWFMDRCWLKVGRNI